MIVYEGKRIEGETSVTRLDTATTQTPLALPWRLDLANHSPTGLEWGYGGSGPAQLALALLADTLPPDAALRLHQPFKWEVVASLPHTGWQLTSETIQEIVSHLQSTRTKSQSPQSQQSQQDNQE